jgi:hypothetical protein
MYNSLDHIINQTRINDIQREAKKNQTKRQWLKRNNR